MKSELEYYYYFKLDLKYLIIIFEDLIWFNNSDFNPLYRDLLWALGWANSNNLNSKKP